MLLYCLKLEVLIKFVSDYGIGVLGLVVWKCGLNFLFGWLKFVFIMGYEIWG